MAYTKILINNPINHSLQVGDTAYVSTVNGSIADDPVLAGKIVEVQPSYIIIAKDFNQVPIIDSSMFLLFEKANEANDSSLKGYYADVTFENNSNKYAELFAISSEVTPSSK